MSYPAQVSRESLIETARQMIEAAGSAEGVSLATLAKHLGVKAPSLYRYVQSKTELLQGVNLITVQRLTESIHRALRMAPADLPTRVIAMSRAYRNFAVENPVTYQLAFSGSLDTRPDLAEIEALVVPLQDMMAQVTGKHDSLMALRGLWALLHGFAVLELQGRFERGGSLDAAFMWSLESYVAGCLLNAKGLTQMSSIPQT